MISAAHQLSFSETILFPGVAKTQAPELDPSQPITLRMFYTTMMRPLLGDQSASSLKEDATALKWWEKTTGNPDIREADKAHLERMRDEMLKAHKSPATINKTYRELIAMFSYAASSDCQVISKVPSLGIRKRSRLIREPAKHQRETITLDELARLWDACKFAKYPRDEQWPAPKLWRVALVLFWTYGPRTRDVFSLNWDDVLWKDRLLQFEAMKTSKLQGLPLTDTVIKHLRSIEGRTRRVFPGFNSTGVTLKTGPFAGSTRSGYYVTWQQEICANAGIDGEKLWIKHFRESMVTRYNESLIYPNLGNWIAGHYVPGVSAQSYDRPDARIRKALEAAEVPACFADVDPQPPRWRDIGFPATE